MGWTGVDMSTRFWHRVFLGGWETQKLRLAESNRTKTQSLQRNIHFFWRGAQPTSDSTLVGIREPPFNHRILRCFHEHCDLFFSSSAACFNPTIANATDQPSGSANVRTCTRRRLTYVATACYHIVIAPIMIPHTHTHTVNPCQYSGRLHPGAATWRTGRNICIVSDSSLLGGPS